MELEGLHNLWSIQSQFNILLVSIDKQWHIFEVWLSEKLLQLFCAFFESHVISRVDHIHEPICVFIIVLPIWSNLTLTTDVPYIKLKPVL